MNEIIKPDYINYVRLGAINAEEAKWVLASIELCGKDISDPDEYNKLLEEKKIMASKVLIAAIEGSNGKKLPFSANGFYRDVNESGITVGYLFNAINFKITEFCSWAKNLNYDLPDEFTALTQDSGSKYIEKNIDAEEAKTLKASKAKKNMGGKPKGSLSQAMEYVYLKIKKEGNSDTLQPLNIAAFLKRFRGFADDNENRNLHDYVLERIQKVNPSDPKCTVITKDRILKSSGQRNNIEQGRIYSMEAVSKRLTELRVNHPLS